MAAAADVAAFAKLSDGERAAALAAINKGGKRGGGKDKGDKRCRTHKRFGDKAYSCGGGDCPDRNKPLAVRPVKTAAAVTSGTEMESDLAA